LLPAESEPPSPHTAPAIQPFVILQPLLGDVVGLELEHRVVVVAAGEGGEEAAGE
jgi:protein gp37